MKLNVAKCTFRISSKKFLGFMVSNKGIEANPEKIEAPQNLEPPINLKELHTLTMIASLDKFISKCSDICQPFFKTLKKSRIFVWDEEYDKALADFKEYLSKSN